MPFTPLAFTGISSYSDDLNTVLKRAVSIASLPLKRLQNDDADILSKKTSLGSLTASVSDLGASLTALVSGSRATVATSSNPAKVSVSYAGATSSATYTINEITSIAAAASETSAVGYLDSTAANVSTSGTVKLVIGSNEYTINLTPATNNLAGLRDAINNLGAGVNATVLTTGTGLTPNYLSLTSDTFGETTLRLIDDPVLGGANTDLLTSDNQGSNASFKLNGVPVSKPSNVINDVVSGVTFTVLDTTDAGEKVTISLHTSRTQLQSAIQDFANRYNALVDEVGKHVGQGADLLSGDFLVREVQSDLRLLTSYTGQGSVRSLTDLGIALGADGKITFDTAAFGSLSDSQVSGAFDFFGSGAAGFSALAGKFTQIADPVGGLAKLQQDNYDQADKRIQKDIDSLNDRITDLQTNISAKLQAADALLALLDSQQRILTASLDALNVVTFGKKS